MLVTITKVEQEFTKNDAEYRKVTGIDEKNKETTKLIFDNLKQKWDLLEENRTLEFKMEHKGQFWNVVDINDIKLPPPEEAPSRILPEHQKVIDEAKAQIAPKPVPEPSGMATGMITKEIGDMIRANKLAIIFGAKVASNLVEWYRSQTLGITRINYDDKDLPKFEVH